MIPTVLFVPLLVSIVERFPLDRPNMTLNLLELVPLLRALK